MALRTTLEEALTKVFSDYTDIDQEGISDFLTASVDAVESVVTEHVATLARRAAPSISIRGAKKKSPGNKKPNQYSKFYSKLSKILKEVKSDQNSLDFTPPEPFVFSAPTEKVDDKKQAYLDELNTHDDMTKSTEYSSLWELIEKIRSLNSEWNGMAISSIVWSFYTPQSMKDSLKDDPTLLE